MECFLEGLNTRTVPLKNNVKKEIGRSKVTKITDVKLSRLQLEVTANFAKRTVLIKQVGPNDSYLNGNPIGIGMEVTAKANDTINLLENEFPYKVVFSGSGDASVNAIVVDGQQPPKKIPKMFLPKGQALAEDFRKDVNLTGNSWEHVRGNELLIYSSHDTASRKASPNVAAFDMDGTIITTKSGRVFPRDDLDWRFLFTSVQVKLPAFLAENPNYKIVFFTNQAGLEKNAAQIPSFKKKIESIVKGLGVPVIVFIAIGKNEFRKPMTGSWDLFVQKFNQGVEPDRTASFFCGDAAGRKKDHSVSDRLFAINLGLRFLTPEEFFQGQKSQEFKMPEFIPSALVESTEISNDHIKFPYPQEMIIMVGYQGSGKSNFAKSVLVPKSYVHVNRDTMKSMAKCISTADQVLASGGNVVVDNTNGTKKAREDFIKVGKKHNCVIRCFKMMVNYTHAQHNNKFRKLINEPHDPVPTVAFNTYRSQFQEPTLDEGFTEVVEVNFVPRFKNDEHMKIYSKFLIEK